MNRRQLPLGFFVPISECTFEGIVELDGCRNLAWRHDKGQQATGALYHQDCTTEVEGHVGMSYIYIVIE